MTNIFSIFRKFLWSKNVHQFRSKTYPQYGYFCYSLIKAHELLTSARAFAADVRVGDSGVRLWFRSIMGAVARIACAQN